MRYKQVNSTHENMIRAVIGLTLSAANMATTALVVAFLAVMNALKANIDSVDLLRASIAQSSKGYAAQKKALKIALSAMSATIMKAAYAYAIANDDDVLAAKMKISRSKLKEMKYVDLITFVGGAIDLVTPLIASLADYGVTPVMLTNWTTLKDQLEDVISNPQNALANREAVNKDIQNTLRECMLLLVDQADQLAWQFINLDLNYYNQYLANRKLHPHHFSTQLKATVVDELGQPILGATVSVDGTGRTGVTDEHGYVNVNHVPFGIRSVTVTVGTISRTYGPFRFKKGHAIINKFESAPEWATPPVTTASETTTTETNS